MHKKTNHNTTIYKAMHCPESGPVRLPFVLSATISARPKVGQLRICQNCPSSVHLCSVYTIKCIRKNCPWRVQACIRTDVYVKTAPISLGNFFVPCSRSPGHPQPPTPPQLTEAFDIENS